MCGIYLNQDFYIDTRNNNMTPCDAQAGCPLLQTDGNLYAYGGGDPAWTDTQYRRTIRATYIPPGETEIQIEVTVRWRSGRNQEQVFTLTSMMYRWVDDSIAG